MCMWNASTGSICKLRYKGGEEVLCLGSILSLVTADKILGFHTHSPMFGRDLNGKRNASPIVLNDVFDTYISSAVIETSVLWHLKAML